MTIPAIVKETGLPQATLYEWRKKARAKARGAGRQSDASQKWSSESKFQMVVETMPLSAAELGEYCRRKGVYPEQIAEWKMACMGANEQRETRREEQKNTVKMLTGEVKTLKKELRVKEKALAETAALLVLRKKLNAIWGESEGE